MICLDCGSPYAAGPTCSGGSSRLNPALDQPGSAPSTPNFGRTVTPWSRSGPTSALADCEGCGGRLKPDVVFFGESVPKPRVEEAYRLVDAGEVLVVLGSSLTVMSGLRFVRHNWKLGRPVVIINRGPTRGDEFATLKVDAGCSETLTALAAALP